MKARPVRRSDGESYASMADAARALVREWGVGNVYTTAHNICNCVRGRHATAYGYGWTYADDDVCPTCGRPFDSEVD